ncbi:MAG TPA: hypothetical protein VH044_20330 [Polyangiaceae bacterium]|nr:hypothetical protein [Polyangiaceae bacterium]
MSSSRRFAVIAAAAAASMAACSDGKAWRADVAADGLIAGQGTGTSSPDAAPPSGGDAAPSDGAAASAPPPTVYVAQAADFTGFCRWSSAPATPARDSPFGVHGLQDMTVYWKASPPHDASEFPVGTIILKESEQPDAGDRIVFAMVKRLRKGAGYNTGGADGWEWFSLQDTGDCSAEILWRGPAPPILTTYSDLLTGDCNGCHANIADNDEVWDTALQLSRF